MNYEEVLKKFNEEPGFHALVEVFYSFMIENRYTRDQMESAVMLAVKMYEENHAELNPFTTNLLEKCNIKRY